MMRKVSQVLQQGIQSKFWIYSLLPFLVTRLFFLLMAWLERPYAVMLSAANNTNASYFLSPVFWVDLWSRWDAKWYLSIIDQGYQAVTNYATTFTNLAFFPLYPGLVKLMAALIPGGLQSDTLILAVGILFSTVCFFTALYLIYRMVLEYIGDQKLAQNTLLLMVFFPTSFFFNSFYTESLFLLLTVGVFYLGLKRHWILAAVLASLATLTRPPGILILIPLAWMYMEARHWKLKAIRWDGMAMGIAPLCLISHFYFLYNITGDALTFFHSQLAWGRNSANLLQSILQPFTAPIYYFRSIDLVIYALFLAVGIYLLVAKRSERRFPTPAFGLYVLVTLLIPPLTGSFTSTTRFLSVLFPVFVGLASLCRKKWLCVLLICLFMLAQAVCFFYYNNFLFIE